MERNDNILKENDMLFSKRDSKSTDNASENIEEFCSSIEFVSLVDQGIKTLIYGLPNHLSSWY